MYFLILKIYHAIFSPKIERRFDLFGLPRVAFDRIYQYFGFEDLIVLAACSKRTQAFIKAKEAFLNKLTSCELHITIRTRHIMLVDVGRFSNRNTFVIEVLTENRVRSWYNYSHIERIVRGARWRIQRSPGNWKVEGDTLSVVLFWYQFLKDTFNCRLQIYIGLGNNIANQVDELYETDVLHVADKMVLDFGQISNLLMKHILDNVEARDLHLAAYPFSNFQYDNVLARCPKICLCRPLWLNMEHAWEMVLSGVREMEFAEAVSWSSTDFNQFLKRWLESTNRTFEYILLAFTQNECIPAVVLDGIETLPAAGGNRRVICRRDGVRATLVLQEDSSYYSTLTVFYDSNRDLRNVFILDKSLLS